MTKVDDPQPNDDSSAGPNRRSTDKAMSWTASALPRPPAEFFAQLADRLPICVVCKNVEGNLIYLNNSFAEMIGKPASELYGKTDHQLFPKKLADKYRSDDLFVMETGNAFRDIEVIETDETPRDPRDSDPTEGKTFVEVRKTPLRDENENIVGTKAVFWDVTLRKRAEAAAAHEGYLLHALMDHLPDSIYFKDAGSRFIRGSRAQAIKFGYTSTDDISGKTDADIFSHEHAQAARKDELEIMRTGKPIHAKIERETWDDAPDTWASTTKMPLRDAAGNIVGTFGISRNVTGQVRAEEALRKAKEEADHANRAKGDFLANMSHEIRTPMNAVIGISELLLDTDLTNYQREYLNMVLSSGESLLGLINEILDFSKIEAGKFELDIQPFDLRDVVGDTVRTLSVRAQNKSLELFFSVANDVPHRVRGDRARLRQVLVNLLGNAIKFTSEGEVVLDVKVKKLSERSVTLEFQVRDTGIGIAADKIGSVFNEFEQADTSTTRQYGGTGLGLTISKKLIELMDGSIDLKSELNVGSTFIFDATLEIEESDTSERANRVNAVEGTRALIVDDNDTNRRILCDMLSGWGMIPISIKTPKKAIDSLTETSKAGEPLPLVLTDFQMPDVNGLDFVQQIRDEPDIADATVIMLTSGMKQDDAQRCAELRIVEKLIKPVKQAEVFEAIVAALGTPDGSASNVATSAPVNEPDEDKSKSLHLLLAEDNIVNQKLAVGALEAQGHKVTVANHGLEALEFWRKETFDAILMDVQMPEMDGFEATRAIRKIEAESSDRGHSVIIAMTAHARESDREDCLKSGMDEYMSKPIRIAELCKMLDEVTTKDWKPKTRSDERSQPKMSIDNSSQKIIDWEIASQAVNGDQDLLKIVAQTLVEAGPGMIDNIKQSITANDPGRLRISAHALKGSVLFLGIDRIREPALELERMGEAGTIPEDTSLLQQLDADWEAVKKEVEEFTA